MTWASRACDTRHAHSVHLFAHQSLAMSASVYCMSQMCTRACVHAHCIYVHVHVHVCAMYVAIMSNHFSRFIHW